MNLVWIVIGVYLLVGSIYDKKSLTLPVWFLVLGAVLAIPYGCYRIFSGEMLWQQWLGACLPGLLWMVLSFLTREQMGYGDGMVLLMLGSATDIQTTLLFLMIGLAVGFLWSIWLLIVRKAEKHKVIPFIPLLLVAYGFLTGEKIWG